MGKLKLLPTFGRVTVKLVNVQNPVQPNGLLHQADISFLQTCTT